MPKFAALAADVTRGAAQEVMYRIEVIYKVPPSTVRTIFPLKTAAIRHTAYGIVAKSPKGMTLLPGKIKAKRIVIGTSSNELDRTAE